ncbi:unnamed protein product [Macrosiphum euphorbiae]|uniref:Uncharacterized protein n=1 Tax=Macrosiphum euphorbiae TaxID=13131 RepID=A0AAV0Y2G3_9HEMI|nr:unnamed protein product [Macrosiphum euphorbiae]
MNFSYILMLVILVASAFGICMGCGTDEEIDHLKEVTIKVEGALTGLTLASPAITGWCTYPTSTRIWIIIQSAGFLMNSTDTLIESLDRHQPQYDECRRFIEELITQTKNLRDLGFTVARTIPYMRGTPSYQFEIAKGVSTTTIIVSLLNRWKEKQCVTITGNCTLPNRVNF